MSENDAAKKKSGDDAREKLLYTRKNGYDRISPAQAAEISGFAVGYREFIDRAKTERLAAAAAVEMARAAGFKEYKRGRQVAPGDRVYAVNRDKYIALAVIGKRGADKGVNITAAHTDAPRIDLKPFPLYEESELCLLKTHYYGGIKKYQWTAIPLALHGVIYDAEGDKITVSIGEDTGDPVFTISDLLPHLGKDQMKKSMEEGVTGEGLNALAGSVPYDCEGKDKVKLAVLSILNEKYGVTERGFVTAELSLVPAYNSRDVGLDRSLIGAYAHDDRVCSYAALKAIMELDKPDKTAVALLVDKEEIGSEGVTGMKSAWFETFIADLCGGDVRGCFENSACLSADVSNAFDPNYPDVSEKNNATRLNYGAGIMKYVGSRGKAATSDASSEFFERVCVMLDKNNIVWQTGEMGKVDQGGGGTVAMYLASRNIDVIDVGVPVLSMHAPFEVISKLDLYMTYKAMAAFYTDFI